MTPYSLKEHLSSPIYDDDKEVEEAPLATQNQTADIIFLQCMVMSIWSVTMLLSIVFYPQGWMRRPSYLTRDRHYLHPQPP